MYYPTGLFAPAPPCAKVAGQGDLRFGKTLCEHGFGSITAIWARPMRHPVLAASLLLAASAAAAPPQNADPALAPWYRSLIQPGTTISCCSLADCRPTEYRTKADHYEALVGGSWL